MKVLLIQPPLFSDNEIEPLFPEKPVPAPPWRLMCIYAYLRQRTRHETDLVDCRVLSDWKQTLVDAADGQEVGVAVINVDTDSIGEAAAVLDAIKRSLPTWTTAVCGSYPSQFPGSTADLGRADYALAGDPEPILRDLLEYHDIPRKLIRVPGLLARWMPPGRPASWLDDLRSLAPADGSEISLAPYRARDGKISLSVRLTRGHTRVPADRACGDGNEPLRVWPMERFACILQRSISQGIHEIVLTDPPGVWTPERLNSWCQTLLQARNTQSWSLRMLPTLLADETVERLQQSRCRGIEFLYPATDADVLARYGCVITPAELYSTSRKLESAGLSFAVRFWLGGPESDSREARHVARILRQLHFPHVAFEPFPFLLDAPIVGTFPEARARMEEWQNWAGDPWTHAKPERFWKREDYFQQTVSQICAGVRRDPKRIIQRLWLRLRSRNWIHYMETRSADFWTLANTLHDANQRSK